MFGLVVLSVLTINTILCINKNAQRPRAAAAMRQILVGLRDENPSSQLSVLLSRPVSNRATMCSLPKMGPWKGVNTLNFLTAMPSRRASGGLARDYTSTGLCIQANGGKHFVTAMLLSITQHPYLTSIRRSSIPSFWPLPVGRANEQRS
jgi:hypothetical protein